MASYYVYIVLCEDGSLYTGYTRDVLLRLELHMSGKGAKYTRTHKPKRLFYIEEFNSKAEAMKRERVIKNLKHRQKLALRTLH